VHALGEHAAYIKNATLAINFDFVTDIPGGDAKIVEEDVDHHHVRFRIARAAA
jgi:hypothetical protein